MRVASAPAMKVLCLFAALATGCVWPTYEVRRSAFVPHLVPPARSGQPPAGRVQLAGYDSTVIVPVDPVEAPNANSGLYVARHQIGGGARIRVGESSFDVGPEVEVGLPADAMRTSEDAPGQPEGATWGSGISMQYAIPLGDMMRLGIAGGFLLYTVPYREIATCISGCSSGYEESGRHFVPVYSLSLLPSVRVNRSLVAFGGVTFRNQPTNTGDAIETKEAFESDDSAEVRAGPMNMIVAAGVEVDLGAGLKAFTQLAQPITRDPLAYGPSVGAGLSLALGEPPDG